MLSCRQLATGLVLNKGHSRQRPRRFHNPSQPLDPKLLTHCVHAPNPLTSKPIRPSSLWSSGRNNKALTQWRCGCWNNSSTRTRTLDFGLISSSQLKSLKLGYEWPKSLLRPAITPATLRSQHHVPGWATTNEDPSQRSGRNWTYPMQLFSPPPSLSRSPSLPLPPSSSLSQRERDRETERQRDREREIERERERERGSYIELTRRQDRKSVNREAGKHLYPSRTETQSCTLHKFVSGAPVMCRMLSGPVLESLGFEFLRSASQKQNPPQGVER